MGLIRSTPRIKRWHGVVVQEVEGLLTAGKNSSGVLAKVPIKSCRLGKKGLPCMGGCGLHSQNKRDRVSERKPVKKGESPKNSNIVGQGQISLDTLIQALTDHQLSEIEYEVNGCRIYISKQNRETSASPAQVTVQPATCAASVPPPGSTEVPQMAAAPEPVNLRNHPGIVKAPMVGVVYVAPEPGAAPFVRVGDSVNPGQTLLIIEAMKVLNPIKASKAGKVLEIFVHNQKPVEYDEPLLIISD